jgi:asparagine synthetase B (glutamine-hydrolysing)
MKWFFGYISLEKKNFNIDMKSKYEEYYGISWNGKCNLIKDEIITYNEMVSNASNISEYFNKDNVIVVGEIEIDNIHELQKEYEVIFKTEEEAIIFLYHKYGTKFFQHLYGRFAFILYDYKKKSILLVRDQFGLKQLFYIEKNGCIFFANNLFLLNDFYNNNLISKTFMHNYFIYNGICDFNETPYKNVKRINVASYILIDLANNKITYEEYWKLNNIEINYKLDNKQVIKEFRKILYESTLNLIKKYENTGIALSGGIDSSIIFSLLADKNISAYSAIFDKLKSCDERYYIKLLENQYNAKKQMHYVVSDESGLFVGYPENYFFTSEPHINIINKKFSEEIFIALKKDGLNYILDGFFADHVLAGNIIYLLDSIKNQSIISTVKAINTYALNKNISFWYVLQLLLQAKTKKAFIPDIDKKLCDIYIDILDSEDKYNNKDMIIQIKSSITRNFGDLELAPRYEIECLHPYVNRKLIEFLYSLPGDFRLKNGVPKFILREAYKNKVPDEIMGRISKTQHVELSQKGLSDNWDQIYNDLKEGIITQLDFIPFNKVQWIEVLNKFRSGQAFNDDIFIYIVMEFWLQNVRKKFGSIQFY